MTSTAPSSFTFEIGQILRHEVTVFRISEIHGAVIFLEHMVTLERRPTTRQHLLDEYFKGKLAPASSNDIQRAHDRDLFQEDENALFPLPLADLGKAAVRDGHKKLNYINELHRLGYTCLRPTPILALDIQRLAQRKKDTTPPAASTIYSASLILAKNDGDQRAIYPRYIDRGGRYQTRWSDESERVFKLVVIDLQKDKKAKIKAADLESRIKEKLKESHTILAINSMMPSRSSIERRILVTFDAYDVEFRNHGEEAAKKKYRNWYPRDRATSPCEVFEFDDKDTRQFLWDEHTELPVGRAFVTTGIDQCSAAPLGFSVSDHHRSTLSAKEAYLNSVLPFDSAHEDFRLVKSLPNFFGQSALAIFDNALYNHAADLEATIFDISPTTGVGWSKPRTPTEKSVVEDFNGRMVVALLEKLPGFGGPKGTVDRLTEGVEGAALTVQHFRQTFHKWVFDEYCNTPRAKGLTPLDLWLLGIKNVKQRLPVNIKRARMAAMLKNKKKLRPEGLSLGPHLAYLNPQLTLLQRHFGSNFSVEYRYNPNDLDFVYVIDPRTREYLEVPCTAPPEVRCRSLYQYRLILKLAKAKGITNPSLQDMWIAREELRKIVQQLRFSTKRRERAKGKKLAFDAEMTSPPEKEVVSEMESVILSVGDIELEPGDEGWDIELDDY